MIDISFIVVTYNPSIDKVKKTLSSILKQKHIEYEIIISDDGSKEFPEREIVEYFEKNNFKEYQILLSENNEGTVKNYLKGLEKAKAKYVKGISPGDCLFDEETIANWLMAIKEKNAIYSYGNAVYYENNSENIEVVRRDQTPYYSGILNSKMHNLIKIDYLLLKDQILGASLITEKETTIKYIKKIENKIKYTEDCIFRIMIADDIFPHHYDENVIWYEANTGISSGKEDKWGRIIRQEVNISDEIINEEGSLKGYLKSGFNTCVKKQDKRRLRYIIFPVLILLDIQKRLFKKKTSFADIEKYTTITNLK